MRGPPRSPGVTCADTVLPYGPCLLVSQVTDVLANLNSWWVPGPLLLLGSTGAGLLPSLPAALDAHSAAPGLLCPGQIAPLPAQRGLLSPPAHRNVQSEGG